MPTMMPRRWVRGIAGRLGGGFARLVGRSPRFVRPKVLLVFLGAFGCAAALLSCCGRPGDVSPHHPIAGVGNIRVLLTPSAQAQVELSVGGPYRLLIDGREVDAGASLATTTVSRSRDGWNFGGRGFGGGVLVLQAAGQALVCLNDKPYRGEMRLIADGGGVRAVNVLDMESYLAGVLARELLGGWSDETYAALAVAARGFAMYHLREGGSTRSYDVGADQGWQVYGGAQAETEKSWRAVRQTHGLILAHGPAGREQPFLPQYSAACGGHVNAASVIRPAPDIEPLSGGQACDDCSACPRYRWPTVRLPAGDVRAALRRAYPNAVDPGPLREVRVASATHYGRAVWLDVVGAEGVVRVRAEDLRLAMLRSGLAEARRLNSMNCRVEVVGDYVEFTDGRGFGHGVGLCQWGAEGKARKGWSYKQILGFYYPGASLVRAY